MRCALCPSGETAAGACKRAGLGRALQKQEDLGSMWEDRTLWVLSVQEPQPGRRGVCSGASPREARRSPDRDLTGPPGCPAECSGWRRPVSSRMGEGVGGAPWERRRSLREFCSPALGVVDTEFLPCHSPEPWTFSTPRASGAFSGTGPTRRSLLYPTVFAGDLQGAQGSPSQAAYPSPLSGPSRLWLLHEEQLLRGCPWASGGRP